MPGRHGTQTGRSDAAFLRARASPCRCAAHCVACSAHGAPAANLIQRPGHHITPAGQRSPEDAPDFLPCPVCAAVFRGRRLCRYPAGRPRPAPGTRRPARAWPEHRPGAGQVRRAQPTARPARRPEEPVADDQPLGLPAVHRVLRARPRHRCGPQPGHRQRGRPQASDPLSPARANPAQMTQATARFPAEWEPQSAILIAWPNADTDWADRLGDVEDTYIAMVAAITRFQPVIVCVADADVEAYARARLASARVQMDQVRFVEVPYDDTWLRDSWPLTPRDGDGFRPMDFRFTGWGGRVDRS